MNLKHITDKQLLLDAKALSLEGRKITTLLLHHIREIDKRKLYSDLGYPSLFRYVVQELGFSEGSAGRRINSSRLLEDIPEIEKKIVSGDLTLTNLSKAADKFKQENIFDTGFKKEVLSALENTSTRVCEKTLSEITTSPVLIQFPKPLSRQVNISEENFTKLSEIRGLLAYKRLSADEIHTFIFDHVLNYLVGKKFKTNTKGTHLSSSTRYIPAALKKEVYQRDKVCQKCGGKFALEFDHRRPYALGGRTDKTNLRLLCRSCNQRARLSAKLGQGMY